MSESDQGNALEQSGQGADSDFSSDSADNPAQACGETDWLLIELRDHEGNPAKGAKYRVELPDGSVIEGTLDENGRAGVEGIDPGSCTVTFPEFAEEAWNPL
jgi:hypothetical protein